jgi:hypothetical protein
LEVVLEENLSRIVAGLSGRSCRQSWEARKELGPGHEPELVEGFLAKIEQEIDRRVDERVAKLKPRSGSAINPATLGVCIPIVAVAGGIGHLPGLVVAFVALAFVFAVNEWRR